jgi:ABC-type transport system involved in multi-copper enzyme maturation permease subunit
MPAWKSWVDLRRRFYYSLVGLLLLLALVMALYVIAGMGKPPGPLMQAAMQGIQQQGYAQYINSVWFSGKGNAGVILFVSALFLSAGGILSEKKTDSLLLTLAFPVRRWHWVLMHAAVASGLILALSLISTLCIVLGSLVIRKPYPIDPSLMGVTIGLWLGCFPWIGICSLLNSIIHSSMKSVLVLFAIYLILLRMSSKLLLALYHWTPWCLAEHAFWLQSIPWGAMLVSMAIGLMGILLAALRFAREDI